MVTKKKSETGICTYCGEVGPITKDHIPPQSLFGIPRPSDLITVPACLECNQKAARDDEYFKQIILLRHETYEHPVARKALPSVYRSPQRPNARGMKSALFKVVHKVDLYTPAGVFVGQTGVFAVSTPRIVAVIERIARGIFFWRNKRLISENYLVQAFTLDNLSKAGTKLQIAARNLLRAALSVRPIVVGGDVFSCWFYSPDPDTDFSIMFMFFYARVGYLCLVRPKLADDLGALTSGASVSKRHE